MITNKNIDNGNGFDWGKASEDYAKFRDIYPPLFYQKIVDLGLCVKGQTVLDLGTGTGVLPRNMYQLGANFTGVDLSRNQIAQAKKLSHEAGMNIEYLVSSAEELIFPAQSFDVVTACQCFLYFDQSVVLPKIHRLLKNNGHFCILFMAWLPEESEIAKTSENLVLKYNPAWTGGNFKREQIGTPDWLPDFFELENAIAYDLQVPFTRESWHGRMIACRGIGASSLTAREISAFEAEHLAYLNTLPETFDIIHHATILNLRKKTK